jgi:hypothetical protein
MPMYVAPRVLSNGISEGIARGFRVKQRLIARRKSEQQTKYRIGYTDITVMDWGRTLEANALTMCLCARRTNGRRSGTIEPGCAYRCSDRCSAPWSCARYHSVQVIAIFKSNSHPLFKRLVGLGCIRLKPADQPLAPLIPHTFRSLAPA